MLIDLPANESQSYWMGVTIMKKKNKKSYKSHSYPKKNRSHGHQRFYARFFSTRNGGIAFRIKYQSEVSELLSENNIDRSFYDEDDDVSSDTSIIEASSKKSDMFSTLVLDESEKFYIDTYNTRSAIDGDTVLIDVISGHDAKVTEVIHRSITEISGVVFEGEDEYGNTVLGVEPDIKRLHFLVLLDVPENRKPTPGDKVTVKITEYPDEYSPNAEGHIIKNYGSAYTKAANYAAILEENSVITEFSDEALAEADVVSLEPISLDGRVDLRLETVFTLDSAEAKDLDDAISVKKSSENYILSVHIADVSHYVREGSRLDREAMSRGTSIYFADKVIPMLPQALSNGICSLNGGADRYALTARIVVDPYGNILSTDLMKTVIRSCVRGVYSEFNSLVSGTATEEIKAKYAAIPKETLDAALELYEILKKKSNARGALELDTVEAGIVLDSNDFPVEIVKRERGVGELLIEQFMLCANEGVADWLNSRALPCVYRVHGQPDGEKLSAFFNFAHGLGISCPYSPKGAKLSAKSFASIIEQAKELGVSVPVSTMLLRTMMKARYSATCSEHFGLGAERYCHFTSPIRRYPDLSVHRIISAALECDDARLVSRRFSKFAELSAEMSTERELCALNAERQIDALFKALYLSKHIGEEFDATVSGVTSFGMFCSLDNTCEGLVPLTSLPDRYEFNEGTLSLSGAYHTFRLGDNVRVRVENVDIPTQKVDFSLTDEFYDELTRSARENSERYASSSVGTEQFFGNLPRNRRERRAHSEKSSGRAHSNSAARKGRRG